ncbi:hypothetical protein ACIQJT_35150 [Streptomyces sp. NPDC091972]|uniref:hypothetical protein n=1 Tax=Streptomyces sp. NPDC091972 TaxID=3366007 RepID=UPI003810D0CB
MDGLPPAVQLLVAARTSLVAPGHLARLRERGEVDHVTVPVDREDLAQVLRFAWTGRTETGVGYTEQEFLDDMPLAQSRLGCSWFTTFDADADSEPLVVICGDSAEDFCYSYTRQRVVGDAHWLPRPGHRRTQPGGVHRVDAAPVRSCGAAGLRPSRPAVVAHPR